MRSESDDEVFEKQRALTVVTSAVIAVGVSVVFLYLLIPAVLVLALWLGLAMLVVPCVVLMQQLIREFLGGNSTKRNPRRNTDGKNG